MDESLPVELQLIRTHHHLTLQCNPAGAQLSHRLHLFPGHPVPSELEHALLRQMECAGSRCRTGAFYTGGVRRPYLFLFELTSDSFSCIGQPCSAAQAEQRFLPAAFPDVSSTAPCAAIMLHRTAVGYRADASYPLPPGERHLLRQCLWIDGPDFPEICFQRGGPVRWFHPYFHSGHVQCHQLFLLPLCTECRQALLLHRTISLEETLSGCYDSFSPHVPALTPKENQVLVLAGQGLSNRAIAALLHRQEGTVKKQLSCAYTKLGLTSRYDLLRQHK